MKLVTELDQYKLDNNKVNYISKKILCNGVKKSENIL